jgi:ATP-dependent protease ClpP protease subunit
MSKNSDDDYLENIILGKPGKIPPKILAKMHEFYVSGPITGPEDYVEDFDTIRHLTEEDEVKIYLNSCGGVLATAIQWMRVLAETAAHVTVSVEGDCMSAATMIFLSADRFEISPFSSFMVHNYSGGVGGKGHEIYGQAQYERKWSENLLREVYKHFLTEAEIISVLDGKDLWMDVEELVSRMEQRTVLLQQEADLEEATKPKPESE